MRAIVVTAFGGPEVLRVQDIAVPRPARGQVLLRVAYAGVKYAELMARRGEYRKAGVPFVPGLEAAGHIAALGEGVEALRVGQPVTAFTATGGYAEFALASASTTFPLDGYTKDIELTTAAAFPTIVPTAYALLAEVARLRAGETVLIHAAAGGVGTVAAQIARHLGARQVLGTVGSPEKVSYARSFGYDEVVVRSGFTESIRAATAGRGVDVILESIGGEVRTESLEILAPLGRLVVFGNASGSKNEPLSPDALREVNKSLLGFSIGGLSQQDPGRLNTIMQQALHLLINGDVHIDISAILPLSEASEAHRRIERRVATGKMLLQVQE